MSDIATVVGAVRAAQRLLSERLDPKTPDNDKETLTRVLNLLDDDRFNNAVSSLEKREALWRISNV
jgi:hypothetical protein